MRLIVLDQFSEPGGAQQVLLDLLPEFQARGWEALVGMPGNSAMFDRVRELGFATGRVACGPFKSGRKSLRDAARFLWQMPRLARQIRRMLASWGADLLYVNGPRLLPAVPFGVPVVFHAHSYIGPGTARELVARALVRTRASVIANCEFVASPWRRWVPAAQISVVYNGVAGCGCSSAARVSPARPTIGCIGRIAPEKGQQEFVAAAHLIHRARPDACFQIVGAPLFGETGATRYERAVRVAAAGLPIKFTGWVSDVRAMLAEMDLLLVPSAAREATTRVILESYAAGVPVIAFRSGGMPEVIEEGVTGHLAGSAEEMAALAIDLLRGPARLREMSQSARECWQCRFTLQRYRREVLSWLGRAAAGRTKPPPLPPEVRRLPESRCIPRE